MNCSDAQNLLYRYLDRELDAVNAARLEAHLRDCRDCVGAYEREQELSFAIKQSAHRYGAPRALTDRIRRDLVPQESRPWAELRHLTRGWNPIALAASLMLAVAMSSTGTSYYLNGTAEDRVIADVVSSHVRSLMANHLTDVASSDNHTVKPWFTGKVDASPPAVNLVSAGFPLIGGRLDYVDQRPCAVLVYRHDAHVINVMVWSKRDDDQTGSESYTRQGYNLARFSANDLVFWAVSDLNRGELDDFVTRLKTEAEGNSTSL